MFLTFLYFQYFTDKFDTTAWNDIDAIPRAASTFGLTEHSGSRNRLLFINKENARIYGTEMMQAALAKLPTINTRRCNLITNISIENN
jgi:hypothetical protein